MSDIPTADVSTTSSSSNLYYLMFFMMAIAGVAIAVYLVVTNNNNKNKGPSPTPDPGPTPAPTSYWDNPIQGYSHGLGVPGALYSKQKTPADCSSWCQKQAGGPQYFNYNNVNTPTTTENCFCVTDDVISQNDNDRRINCVQKQDETWFTGPTVTLPTMQCPQRVDTLSKCHKGGEEIGGLPEPAAGNLTLPSKPQSSLECAAICETAGGQAAMWNTNTLGCNCFKYWGMVNACSDQHNPFTPDEIIDLWTTEDQEKTCVPLKHPIRPCSPLGPGTCDNACKLVPYFYPYSSGPTEVKWCARDPSVKDTCNPGYEAHCMHGSMFEDTDGKPCDCKCVRTGTSPGAAKWRCVGSKFGDTDCSLAHMTYDSDVSTNPCKTDLGATPVAVKDACTHNWLCASDGWNGKSTQDLGANVCYKEDIAGGLYICESNCAFNTPEPAGIYEPCC